MRRILRRHFVQLGGAAFASTILKGRQPSQLTRSLPGGSQSSEIFTDRAREAGIDFVHFNGMSGEHYYAEMMGSGVALFDYDNDGDLDIFLVQGNMLGPGKTVADAMFPPKGPLRGRLYRNDTTTGPDGSRILKFTDVTVESAIDAHGYGMGVTAGDFNNDGWVDLYVTNFGRNQLWRNNGDGTFTDVTRVSGTGGFEGLSASAAFIDFDRDGWLDLFVCNYLDFRVANNKKCLSASGLPDYCGPMAYNPTANRLFRNRRDGTFEDVTAQSQIGREFNGALGLVCADFNGDGWPDIFVTDDQRPNLLWINQRDGTFKNNAMLAGVALNRDGAPQSCMGVDAGDFDNDGDEDLVISNLMGEYADLYINQGDGTFIDSSFESGLARHTSPFTGFGAGFLDFDNDGWLDVMIVNGEVRTIEAKARAGDRFPLGQSKLLLRNLGNGRFENVTQQGGAVFPIEEVSRGLAFGDIDNDGDIDVLVVNNNGPARLLINNVGHQKHWLGLRMVAGTRPRDMLGTRIALFRPHAPTLWRRVRTDGSYCSSHDPRVLFGLNDSAAVDKVRAYWPSGRIEEWTGLPAGRYTTVIEGSGKAVNG
jgi:hypothetical protein